MKEQSPPLSVVIITLNEERHLARCLQSLPRGSEVCILDSGSTDGTAEVARRFGAKFATRPFTNYSEQKNAALALATRPWILSVDADEELTGALRERLERLVAGEAPADVSGYRVRRRLVFMGRRMRFGRTVDAPLRLIRRGHGRFQADIHESIVLSHGSTRQLAGELLHYSYDDLTDYFDRFNSYTSKVAAQHKKQGRGAPALPVLALRPWFEFFVRYVVRGGILDGYPGYCYALISSFYTFVKYAKLKELDASR